MRSKRNTWLYDDMGWWRGRWVICGFVAAFVVVIAAICLIANGVNSATCAQSGERLGVESHYRFLSGCYYTLANGKQVPSDRWPPKYIHVGGREGR